MMKIYPAIILAAAVMAVPAMAATNLVQNGSFEQTGLSGNFEFDSNYAAGAGKLTGWSSSGGYNLLFHSDNANSAAGNAAGAYSYTGNEYLWASTASPDGGNFIVLDGDQSLANRAVTQQISGLTVGQAYTLSFNWGAGQLHSRSGATTEQLQVAFGNSAYSTAVLNNVANGFTGWQQVSTTFTATNTSQLLSFLSVGTPTGLPPVALLDGVSLTAIGAVPEPASWAMMIVGFGAVGFALRSRRAATVTFA